MMTPFLSFTVEPYVIWAMLMSSSSAAIIRKPVGGPLPMSTWLVNRLAVLSGLISRNESTWFVGGYCVFGDGTVVAAFAVAAARLKPMTSPPPALTNVLRENSLLSISVMATS